MNNNIIKLLLFALFIHKSYSETIVLMSEVFVFKIEPSMFNWTLSYEQEYDNDMMIEDLYTYRASLLKKPDLPEWIQYKYSKRYHCGYLYGVPTSTNNYLLNTYNNNEQHKIIEQLQIIGLNRISYETRLVNLNIHIIDKLHKAKYEVQLKIDNINIDDMFNNNRNKIDTLLNIFKLKLWRTAYNDLYLTFIDSTINLGGRLPLHPFDDEGVIIRFGSYQPFTSDLLELHDEVKPLYKYKTVGHSCPRDFKRTTVDRLFRDLGFALDWCSFQLFNRDEDVNNNNINTTTDTNTILKQNQQLLLSKNNNIDDIDNIDRWIKSIYKSQVPERNYSNEFVYTIILPVIIMSICVWLLSFILCFQHEGITDNSFDRFINSLFDICFYYYYSLQRSKRFNEEQQQPTTCTSNNILMNATDQQKNKYTYNKTYNDMDKDKVENPVDVDDNSIIIIKNIINNDNTDNENENYKTLTLNQRKTISYSCNPRCPSPPPYPGTNTSTTSTLLNNNNNIKYGGRHVQGHDDDDDF